MTAQHDGTRMKITGNGLRPEIATDRNRKIVSVEQAK
jgi:hypothetical protein